MHPLVSIDRVRVQNNSLLRVSKAGYYHCKETVGDASPGPTSSTVARGASCSQSIPLNFFSYTALCSQLIFYPLLFSSPQWLSLNSPSIPHYNHRISFSIPIYHLTSFFPTTKMQRALLCRYARRKGGQRPHAACGRCL
jgi:hypothetical protein